MRKLFCLAILLCSLPSWANWPAITQHTCNAACGIGSTTCVISVAATGAGHLGVVTVFEDSASANSTISSVSAIGTVVHCTNCGISNSSVGRTDASYVLSLTGGVTSMTVTISATTSNSWRACFREYAPTGTPVINAGATPSGNRNQTSTTLTPADVTLTLSAVNGLVIQFGTFGGTASALAGYGNCDFPNGNGICDLLNTTSGASANWTQAPTGQASLGAIAFQESSGAVTCAQSISLMGVGCR